MHIPDNYLSPQTCVVMTAVMLPVWTISIRRIRKELSEDSLSGESSESPLAAARRIPMLGVAAAFSFLGMMFNIPLPGGTTGHAVGGTLMALLVGPFGACISVSTALLLQALLFGDGGILAFGANCFNMAFVMPFAGYGVYRLILHLTNEVNKKADAGSAAVNQDCGAAKAGIKESCRRETIAAGLGSYVGINAAALCAAIEFGIQPMLFRDASGAAIYCPYPLSVSIPAMMAGHLTIFGLAEVVYTVVIYLFLARTAPFVLGRSGRNQNEVADGILQGAKNTASVRTGILLGLLIVLTPLGLLAEGTAWGEWGADEIAAAGAGYTPSGMLTGFSFASLVPDYSMGNLPAAAGYILSAVLGTAILLILFKILARQCSGKRNDF